MSTIPVPKPRGFVQQEKRPVPLPRKLLPQKTELDMPQPESQNTFSRRMRTLSSTSKQITGEISEKVQETKKAVIESTRQSVRRITRRFSSPHDQCASNIDEVDSTELKPEEESINSDIFNSIRFQSPLTVEDEPDEAEPKEKEHIYSNCDDDNDDEGNDVESDDSVSLPPPNHPPPPLPDESFYDKPQSVSNCPPVTPRLQYEAVFPVYPVYPVSSDSDESKTNTIDNTKKSSLQRSGSWSFYDPVTLNEVVYSNQESVEQLTLQKNNGNRSSGESSAYSELNVCYENYILELRKKNENATVRPPTKSTILEFDPLVNTPTVQPNNDIAMLEQILHEDLYGKIQNPNASYDQWSLNSEMETDEYLNPPTPPKRFDSLNDQTQNTPVVHEEKSRTNWFTSDTKAAAPPPETKKVGWMKQLNDVLKKVPESARNIRAGLHRDKYLDRPTLNYRSIAHHKGILFKMNRKSMEDLFGEFHFRWCVLSNGTLNFYADNACDNLKENFSLDSIMSIQLLDKKIKFETEMFCFILNISGKSSRGGHAFGIGSLIECKQWMQRIAEALTNRFPLNIVVDYKKMGWTYLRQGVSGTWAGAWLVVSSRKLYYAKDDAAMCTIDLRKARCIQLQEQDPDTPKTADKGPNLLVDSQEGTLYLRMWTGKETKTWCQVIQTEAYKNGRRLDEQQLTKDDVPVIVEKCINFIYAHGSMSEGIYRRSGSSSTISDILGQFHQNAWAVTLTVDKCTEHDVANVLKRFLRGLPDPLLTSESSEYLCQIADSFQNASEKVTLYRAVLEQFPTVPYKTLKRLLGHLHFIQTQSNKNRMPVDNLAAIWGPTLVHHEGPDGEWSPTEANLVVQLISMYRELFPVSPEELDRERLMLQVLERCYRGATTGQGPAHVKASGDLRVWVHLFEKNGETVNITIGPQKLAADICIELSEKMKLPAYELQLEELVLNDSLRRPVHYSEKVLDVVLRWGYWDEPDRKDNCLVLVPMAKYKQFDRPVEPASFLYDEFKFADNKTKAFKLFVLKFAQGTLCCVKDTSGNVKIQEWKIGDILWYFGHEPRHNPQTKWSITFILRKQPPKRSRSLPFFGYTLGGNDLATRLNWISAMIRAEHQNGLQPPLMNITSPNG